MGLFRNLFKGPQVDMAKSDANRKKMRVLFNQVVENGDDYKILFLATRKMLAVSITVSSTAAKLRSAI